MLTRSDVLKFVSQAEYSMSIGDVEAARLSYDQFWDSSASVFFSLFKYPEIEKFHNQFVRKLVMKDVLKQKIHDGRPFSLTLPYCGPDRFTTIEIPKECIAYINSDKTANKHRRRVEKYVDGQVESYAPFYIMDWVLPDLLSIIPRVSLDRRRLLNLGAGAGCLDIMLCIVLSDLKACVQVEPFDTGRESCAALAEANDIEYCKALQPDDNIAKYGPFDLVLSCRAMSYIFSAGEYASVLDRNLTENTEAFIDIRCNDWGQSEETMLSNWFKQSKPYATQGAGLKASKRFFLEKN